MFETLHWEEGLSGQVLIKVLSIIQAYLSDGEFQSVFGMTKDAFYKQPNWKQELQKRKADLF
jgi:hypothetical protein